MDTFAMQNGLDTMYGWASTNNMCFNPSKFQLLRYGKNTELKDQSQYLTPDGKPIEAENSLRDLGVTMSSDLTFSEHQQFYSKMLSVTFSCPTKIFDNYTAYRPI